METRNDERTADLILPCIVAIVVIAIIINYFT